MVKLDSSNGLPERKEDKLITGSLQKKKRKKGDTYYAVIHLGSKDYKWINLDMIANRSTKPLAQQKLSELLNEYNKSPCAFEKVLFVDYLTEWLKSEESQIDIVTLEGYRQYVNKHIKPYFEPLKLNIQEVTIKHLEDYYSYKSKGGRLDGKPGGLSNRTVKLHSIIINLVFKDALYHNVIQINPNERARIPKNNSNVFKGKFYTTEQINTLLRLFESTLLRDMAYITVLYGLRRSELMGLKWAAIDFTNDTIMIQHTVVLNETVTAKDKTKNSSSNRCYPLLPEVKEILLRVKGMQQANRKLFGNCFIDNDYVFTREDGSMFYPSYVSHMLRKKLAKSDLPPIRWHDLRHSCANLLFSKGWSMKDVSEWLGHSNISTTMNIYTHIDISRKRDMSKGLEGLLIQ